MAKEINANELQGVLDNIIGMIPDTEKQLKLRLRSFREGLVNSDGTVNNTNKNLISNTLLGVDGDEEWNTDIVLEWCGALGLG